MVLFSYFFKLTVDICFNNNYIINIRNEGNKDMMIFENHENSNYNLIATNSIKPVMIQILDDNAEPEVYLHMPEGDLYIDAPINKQWFESFEEAKKWAEHRVGIYMNNSEW